MLAASFPLFTTQMFNNLTIPYAGLLLGCLLILACPLPFILIRYGERIRASSKYAAATTGLTNGGVENGDGPTLTEEKRKSNDVERGLQGPVLGARRSRKALSRNASTATAPQVTDVARNEKPAVRTDGMEKEAKPDNVDSTLDAPEHDTEH